jgi:hypothetical protein
MFEEGAGGVIIGGGDLFENMMGVHNGQRQPDTGAVVTGFRELAETGPVLSLEGCFGQKEACFFQAMRIAMVVTEDGGLACEERGAVEGVAVVAGAGEVPIAEVKKGVDMAGVGRGMVVLLQQPAEVAGRGDILSFGVVSR